LPYTCAETVTVHYTNFAIHLLEPQRKKEAVWLNKSKDNRNKNTIRINLKSFFIVPSIHDAMPGIENNKSLGGPITRSIHENEGWRILSSKIYKKQFQSIPS
jgi:hypothetical protein